MTLAITQEDRDRFDKAPTTTEINAVYKEMYAKYVTDDTSLDDIMQLCELLSSAFGRFSEWANPNLNKEGADDPNVVASWKIRNWCAVEGIPLAKKGRVSIAIENQYRAAHDLPERVVESEDKSVKAPRVKKEKVVTPPSEVSLMRAWGKANGFEVGIKGRLKPELIEAYRKANK